MKTNRIFIFMAAAWVLTACEMAEPMEFTEGSLPENLVEVEEPELTTFVFTSGEEDTKTEYGDHTILWSAGDKIRMAYTVNGNWQNASGNASTSSPAKMYASDELESGGTTASFTVPGSFGGSAQGTYKFYTIYPSKAYVSGSTNSDNFSTAPSATVVIPTEQTSSAVSFDPAADLMIGHSVKTYTSKPTEAIPLMWDRKVTHGEITLKNLNELTGFSPTETIEKVTLTAQSGAELTGSYSVNLTTGDVTATEASNSVTVLGDNLAFDSGNLTFWMAVRPLTFTSLDVTLETDKAVYTRSIESCDLLFPENAHRKLGINMASATRTAKVPYYVKVTENLSDWSGEYLIVYEAGSLAFNGALTTTLYKDNGLPVTIIDNRMVKATTAMQDAQFTIAKSGSSYTIRSASGYYIGNENGNNYINNDPITSFENTISYNSAGYVDVIGHAGPYLRYNLGVGSTLNRFCYIKSSDLSSGTAPIQLFKLCWIVAESQDVATATVTTGEVGTTTQTSAVLNGSFTGETGAISEVGFYWGTTNDPTTKVTASGTTSPFSYTLNNLSAGTTYYYKAYVKEYNAATSQVEERPGAVVSFTTEAAQTVQYYEKVTSDLTDWSGDYLIVYEEGSLACNGALTSFDVVGNSISVTISDNRIEATTQTIAAQFTIAKLSGGNYSIKSKSGYFIGQTSDANGIQTSTTALSNAISYTTSGIDIISGKAHLRYNSNNDQRKFRYYKSSTYTNQKAVQLYKLTDSSSPTVTTSAATSVTQTSAVFNGSYSGMTGTVTQVGFYWGTTNNPTTKVWATGTSSPFTYTLSGLTAGTTYYYKAFAVVDGVEIAGSVLSFSTTSSGGNYLGCYEIPAVGTVSGHTLGNEKVGYTQNGSTAYTKWQRWDTSNSKQKIVTHTFFNDHVSPNRAMRSYTLLQDYDKKCALWVACAMNNDVYPNKVSRKETWTYDPALDDDWQPNLSSSYPDKNGLSYDRGHQLAASYRETTESQVRMTCYFTNMTPQLSSLNQGVWNTTVEANVRSLGEATTGRDTLYVVSGPLFIGSYGTVEDKDGMSCAKPTHYFQCFMKVSFNNSGVPQSAKGAAYLVEHVASPSVQYVTIDYVESLAGFDFFANVPSGVQNPAEATATALNSF